MSFDKPGGGDNESLDQPSWKRPFPGGRRPRTDWPTPHEPDTRSVAELRREMSSFPGPREYVRFVEAREAAKAKEAREGEMAGNRPGHPDIVTRYPADYKPSPADAPLPRVDGPHDSPEGWVGAINPERDPSRGDMSRWLNCGECSRATDGTWQGYPKVAQAIDFPRLGGEDKERMEEWAGTECRDASMTDIEQALDRLGPGSSAIVGFFRESGGGHWFNAVNDAGTVKAVDGQVGAIESWPPSDEGLGFTEQDMRDSFAIYVKPDGKVVK